MRAARVFVAAVLVAGLSGSAAALGLPSAPRCPVFPRSNPWNRRVDKLPVAANSATLIRSIGLDIVTKSYMLVDVETFRCERLDT